MQGEAASLFVQQSYYPTSYDSSWEPYSSANSYTSYGNSIFDDLTVSSPNDHLSNNVIDDIIIGSSYFGDDLSHDYRVSLNKTPDRDPSLFQHSFNSPPSVYATSFPNAQQHGFVNFPNPSIERASSIEEFGCDQDFHSASETESRSPGSESVLSPFSDFKPFDSTLSRLNPQQENSPLSGYNARMHPRSISNMQEPSYLNTDTAFQLSSANSSSMHSPSKLYPCFSDGGYINNSMDAVKIECGHNREDTWPAASQRDVARAPTMQISNAASTISRHDICSNQTKSVKKRTRSRRNRKADKEKCVHLWEFIRDILLEPKYCPSLMKWEDRQTGVFRFVKSDTVAAMWGKKKQNPKMTYEKLSRAMRYYYNRGILERVDGRRLVYKFGPNAYGWKSAEAMTRGETSPSPIYNTCLPPQSVPSDLRAESFPMCESIKSQIDDNQSRLLPSANVLLGGENSYFGA